MPPPGPTAVVTRLAAQDGVAMPWKNGGGTTTELAVRPLGSGLGGGFDWRLSVATIEGDGPFSVMAGYERIIAALAGPELILTHAGTGGDHRRSLAGGSAWLFAGEAATSSVKGAGDAARDFNVMVCRDAGAAHVWDLTPAVLAGWSARSSGAPWTAATRADAVALYAAAGAAEVGVGAEKGALGPGDLWIWERGAKVPSPTSPRETAPISVTPVGATLPRVLVVEIALSARDRTR